MAGTAAAFDATEQSRAVASAEVRPHSDLPSAQGDDRFRSGVFQRRTSALATFRSSLFRPSKLDRPGGATWAGMRIGAGYKPRRPRPTCPPPRERRNSQTRSIENTTDRSRPPPWRCSTYHENSPAAKEPHRPINAVMPRPIGSGPGSRSRATAPTNRPTTKRMIRYATRPTPGHYPVLRPSPIACPPARLWPACEHGSVHSSRSPASRVRMSLPAAIWLAEMRTRLLFRCGRCRRLAVTGGR